MKKITITLTVFALIALTACNSKKADTTEETAPEQATEELVVEKGNSQDNTVYVNKKPVFSFAIDSTWHVFTDDEIAALQKKATGFVGGKMVLDGTQSVVVFMAKQFENGLPLDINDSFMCAVNGRSIGGRYFSTAADYFDYAQEMYRAILPADVVAKMEYKPVTTQTINGKKLDMQEMEIKLDEEKSMVERHYVYFDEKYILDFSIKFSPQEEHGAVLNMVNSILIGEDVKTGTTSHK